MPLWYNERIVMITSGQLRRVSRQFWLIFIACVVALSVFAILIKPVKAATMTMRTGYYVGKGAAPVVISGLGFQPNLVMVKAATATTSMMVKTSAMPATSTSYLTAAAQDSATTITLGTDGFTITASSTTTNMQNIIFRWIAYGGSDCSASGNFCVGTYTGNGAGARTITVGFEPTIEILKPATSATAGQLRTASMPANRTEQFNTAVANTVGGLISGFTSTGFTVGTNNNANGVAYYYIVFGTGSGIAQGTYTGDGVDGRLVAGLGFSPDAVFIKNSTSATATSRNAVYSQTHHYGNHTSYLAAATADATNMIKALEPNGFQLGSIAHTNESAATHYWFAFDGDSPPNTSGTFSFKQGSYLGTGAAFSVTDLGFTPDVVIVKRGGAEYSIMRMSLHGGDVSYHLTSTAAAISGAITSIDADGFSIGTSLVANTSGAVHYWQAFGNAYNPHTNSGAADFAVGAYQGNGIDNRSVTTVPFQPDLIVGRAASSATAVMRTSAHAGDTTSYFSTTNDAANMYQSFLPNGFQVGTSTVNVAGISNFWFAFKAGANFQTGSYTGDGINNRTISIAGFRPDIVWVNRSASQAAVMKTTSILANNSESFANIAATSTAILEMTGGGFTVGVGAPVNTSGGVYRYAVWREPVVASLTTYFIDGMSGNEIINPVINLNPTETQFQCHQTSGTIGDWPDNILRIQNTTANPAWSLSVAATDGPTALWQDSVYGRTFDFNDTTGTGCGDGGDSDTKSGQMKFNMGDAAVGGAPGCAVAGLTQGSTQSFQEGFLHTITLVSAGSGAATDCYWDITDLSIQQTIPQEQLPGDYSLELTLTLVAQ